MIYEVVLIFSKFDIGVWWELDNNIGHFWFFVVADFKGISDS